MSPPMSPRSFAVQFLPGATVPTLDGGLLATCPACSTVNAFRVDADASGGYVSCAARPDTETRCTATDFATALSLDVIAFDDLVGSLRPAGAALVVKPAARVSLRDRVIPRSGLRDLPTLESLIADTILRRTLTFLAGPPASGKSFHAFAWAASVATGMDWMGRAVSQGRVLYVIAEGAYGVEDRLAAWESHHRRKIGDDALTLLPEAVQLADAESLAELVEYVAAEDFDLVVLDTLSRSAVGLDENSASEMSRLIEALDDIRRAMTNGAVVVAHHSSKAGAGLRGSSVIEGAADTVYASSKGNAEAAGTFRLSRTKHKYGHEDDRLSFVWRPEGLSGLLIEDNGTTRPDRLDAFAFAETWRLLVDVLDHGQTFTRTEAWAALKDHPSSSSKGRLMHHITDLLGVGAVVIVSEGSRGVADRLRLNLSAAAAAGLSVERFAPLDGYGDDFLDPVPAP